MPPLLNPRLIHSPFGDPGLFVPFFFKKRALLFDLGDITPLFPKDILKISHCFVSHTHMDHFIGFDNLLRLMLGRGKELHLFGPEGFHANVAGKLAGYTWNLVENYDTPITLVVTEVLDDRRIIKRYPCKNRFVPSDEIVIETSSMILHEEVNFFVETAILTHDIPCLGFSVKEHFHINIRKEMLDEMGLEPGRWLYEFKQMVHEEQPADTPVPVLHKTSGNHGTIELGVLTEKLAIISRGHKIAYITDVAGTKSNIDKIIALAENCDHLFIEAGFTEEHRALAEQKRHLTAYQAGRIAAQSNAGRYTLFHFSPRYDKTVETLEAEAMAGFKAFKKGAG